MDLEVLVIIVKFYAGFGLLLGIKTVVFDELMDGVAVGIFWPLFVVKRAVKLLLK